MLAKFVKPSIAGALVLLIGAVAAAAFYKVRADRLHGQWRAAQAEAEQLRAVSLRPATIPAFVPEPVIEPDKIVDATSADMHGSSLVDRIRELEATLAEKDKVIRELREMAAPPPPVESRGPSDRRDWMEQLQRSDPARYEDIRKQREDRQRQISEQFARKAAYFLQRDTSKMSHAEQESHALMLQLLDETWQLTERMREESSLEERRELRQALREKSEVLNPLLQQERTRTFTEAGLELGYTDEEAARFVEYLNTVIELTSPRGMFRGGPPGGRGPRP